MSNNGSIGKATPSVSIDVGSSSVSYDLTDLTLNDLSSLLVKTGKMDERSLRRDGQTFNVSERLTSGAASRTNNDDSAAMEDLEMLMIRLDNVFQSFHDPAKLRPANHRSSGSNLLSIGGGGSSSSRPPFDPRLAALVSEAGDQAHAFAYQFKLDHDLSAALSASAMIMQ